MSEWKEFKLGDIADITSSKRIFYSEYVDFGVPFYRSKEIINKFLGQNIPIELFISEERYKEIESKFGAPTEGDILLTSVGTLGIPYIVSKNDRFYFKDGNLTWFRKIDKTKVDSNFLFAWLKSDIGKQRLEEIKIGSTQPALTIQGLKSIEISLPDLFKQSAIASIFSSLDNKIDLLNRQNKTVEDLAGVLFREWFTLNADEDWREGALQDYIYFDPREQKAKGEQLFFDMKCLSNNSLSISEGVYRNVSSATSFRNGDTLLAKITPCLENGKTGFVMNLQDDEVARGSTEFIVMRSKGMVSPYWIYCLARDENFREKAIQSMTGTSGRQRVQTDLLKNIDVKMNEALMKEFHAAVTPYFQKIKANGKQIVQLSKLRDALLPKLMSGEIRILTQTQKVAQSA